VGQTVGKMRRMAAEFQGQFMEAMREVEREADLDSVKKEFQVIHDQAKVDASFDPVAMMRDDITKAVEPPAEGGAAQIVGAEIGKHEIGRSEIALTSPDSAAASPAVDPAEAAPEPPAAPRSAAE
jgi:sec-independent protein translocase protein TatB